jgi:hypothetical protein
MLILNKRLLESFVFFAIIFGKVLSFSNLFRTGLRPLNNSNRSFNILKQSISRLRTILYQTTSSNDIKFPLVDFLTDLHQLGSVRFVVQGKGAILEAVGRFENLRSSTRNDKILHTISTDSPCVELHLRDEEIRSIENTIVNKFDKTLRITRFKGHDNDVLLSAILHGDENIAEW